MKIERVVISGGGTGGHIFPAIAIADEIKKRNPDAAILFVGAIGKMEMEKVPAAGYKIEGLTIAGLQRKLTLSNFLLPFKIIKSMLRARRILKEFKPQVVVGVGGYASGPTLKAATMLGIPTLVQEQNSFPGKTNKLLAKSVTSLCTAYEGLERFFPKEKINLTGNPVRFEMVNITGKRDEAFDYYKLDPNKKTILVIGGSLGARTLNQAMMHHYSDLKEAGVQVLWQSGKLYYNDLNEQLKGNDYEGIKLVQFIDRMDLAYAMADVIISRAGAISVSELCLIKKPVILVPSPNVAEDHQTKNAMALVEKFAAILVKDVEAKETLIPAVLDLLKDEKQQVKLADEIAKLGKPKATESIVEELERINTAP
jgi:UDP-N-acetylglucosamine--N-acetylmuramyl-(pentapeptide) pyrophosphoryl-undecaprenol N-acetylglucosamine transferase